MINCVFTATLVICALSFKVGGNDDSYNNDDATVDVDINDRIGSLRHFWKSTGLCPPEPYQNASTFLLSNDMKLNLALIGALPRRGLMQVRIHWLLNLITMNIDINGKPSYNFSDLDKLIDLLHENHLKPGFELMGNPSNHFDDFTNESQVYEWRDLIKTLSKHYIQKYGLEYVQQWNFESWNEPDHRDFNGLNFSTEGFLNYYDASSEGLFAAHPNLRLGGPAESFRGIFVKYCWDLLEHCVNGRNYFNGKKGVRLDFISMHKKGNNTSISILEEELLTISEIHNKYPTLRNIPIFNDEADPLVGWWKPEPWRADNTYASMVAKVVVQHQEFLIKKHPIINYKLLSNDNGFLNFYPSFFDQRTLLTRFQINTTQPETIQLIRKPVYIVTGLLLHLLGEEQVQVLIKRPQQPIDNNYLAAIAAYHTPNPSNLRDSWNLGIVISNSDDMNSSSEFDVDIQLRINNLINFTNKGLMYVTHSMDNARTNPAGTWEQMGRPIYPNDTQLKILRMQELPITTAPQQIKPSSMFQINATLKQPGLLGIHLCIKAPLPPGQVTKVKVTNITTGDVLITWKTHKVQTRCIQTYEVYFSRYSNHSHYHHINEEQKSIFWSFQYTPKLPTKKNIPHDEIVHGFYKVRAVDYFDRKGQWSNPTKYGHNLLNTGLSQLVKYQNYSALNELHK